MKNWLRNKLHDFIFSKESDSGLVAYDNRKLVTEATFALTSPEYNHLAYGIIKLVTQRNPKWEVEVEIDPHTDILK